MGVDESARLSALLHEQLCTAIQSNGGWLPFDRFMAMALYQPGLGYYANHSRKFGRMPASGSDFVTAPEMTPLFARALAVQLAQALRATGCDEIWEFGAGSAALAQDLLSELGTSVRRYHIVELSATLRQRQSDRLARWGRTVEWHDTLPEQFDGVIIGNEVLDAMPVQLLRWDGQSWFERGVAIEAGCFRWHDRPTDLRPPVQPGFAPDTVVETHRHAQAFIRTLAARLRHGAAFFIDYGFPEAEYYHPQRVGGTLMCHRAHRADDNPLVDVGLKDITAHVNFSTIALSAQDAGMNVLGYTSQGRFLLNCGLADMLQEASLPERVAAQRLVTEHEMGELFKVIGLSRGAPFDAVGMRLGDRSHRL